MKNKIWLSQTCPKNTLERPTRWNLKYLTTRWNNLFIHAQVFNNFSYTLQNKLGNSYDDNPSHSTHQSLSVPRKRKFLKSTRPIKKTSSMFKKTKEEEEKPNTIVLTRFGAIFHFYLSEDWPKRLDVLSRVIFPATFLVFNLVYWIPHVGQQHWWMKVSKTSY